MRADELASALNSRTYLICQRDLLGRVKETLGYECCGITPGFVLETTIALEIILKRVPQSGNVEIKWI